ncbi:MAG: BamA/TamA family outer membrane protein [Chitinophagales bacterium]|nr:BamA/TamA family outer membrane protein [Chitinophagales bacterium]MCZ2393801.1 BamA/TamA family outer membrane protein [Chitinophagales bacterium]
MNILKHLFFVLLAVLMFNTQNVFAQEEKVDSLVSINEINDSTQTNRSFFYRALNQTKPVSYLAFPIVYYTPETNLMFGVGGLVSFRTQNDPKTAPTFIVPWFTYSIDKQMTLEMFGSFFHKENKHQLDYELNYKKLKTPYFGIGNKLNKEDKELVGNQSIRLNTVYQNRIKNVFLIGPVYHLDYTFNLTPRTNGLLDTNAIQGKSGGFVQGLGLKMAFDNRDDVYFPYKGNYFGVSAVGYPDFLGSKYQFANVQAEYKSFLNIKKKVILASQIMAQMSFGEVPFYLMPRLGGEKLLRGYTAGVSRDKFLFNLQGELRIPLNRFILSGFFGSGITGDKFMDYFKVKDYTYSIGGGARFRPFKDKNVVARLDVGFWQKTYGVYFVFNEAF